MLVTLGLFCLMVVVVSARILDVFLASPYLNGVIFIVFIFGVLACFWQLWQVSRSVGWLNAQLGSVDRVGKRPRLLAPLAVLMKGNQLPTGMSTSSAQSILDSVATRLDEIREITRYLVNLLIFLGLLGTFYGLATTIPGVVETIRSLNAQSGEGGGANFADVMSGLETQLDGMGTAFGSSLIGLTGSLLVGLLELFAGHGQNRFYREFEEWLTQFTSVGMAEKGLELQIDPNDDTPLAKAFRGLSESLGRLEGRLATQDAKSDQNLQMFAQFQDSLVTQGNMQTDMRNAIRGVEAQLVRMNEDLATGRESTTQELRRDIATVVQTLRTAIDGGEES